MINERDVSFYNENGYLVVRNVLSLDDVRELRSVTDDFVENARHTATHNDVYDLEDSHSPEEPRVRRIKTPHAHHETYARMVAHPNILDVLRKLWGRSIRFDVSKLNLKSAGYGAPVEWHQDWAFYPHTNDDLAAVGIMIDDVDETNGPLMVVPGSHQGPILDHHADGYFCGAIDPNRGEVDFSTAKTLTGPAGSITIHHARAIHGSATNTSGKSRRLLLHQYRAADAWPLLADDQAWKEYRDNLLCGEDTIEPRMANVPVRLPLPPAPGQGSIYENQKSTKNRYFETANTVAAVR